MVTKRFGRLDSPETQYQRVKQRFQGFADAVPVVPLGKPNLSRQRTLPSYAPKELLDERYTRELGQATPSAAICKFRGPRGIVTKPHF